MHCWWWFPSTICSFSYSVCSMPNLCSVSSTRNGNNLLIFKQFIDSLGLNNSLALSVLMEFLPCIDMTKILWLLPMATAVMLLICWQLYIEHKEAGDFTSEYSLYYMQYCWNDDRNKIEWKHWLLTSNPDTTSCSSDQGSKRVNRCWHTYNTPEDISIPLWNMHQHGLNQTSSQSSTGFKCWHHSPQCRAIKKHCINVILTCQDVTVFKGLLNGLHYNKWWSCRWRIKKGGWRDSKTLGELLRGIKESKVRYLCWGVKSDKCQSTHCPFSHLVDPLQLVGPNSIETSFQRHFSIPQSLIQIKGYIWVDACWEQETYRASTETTSVPSGMLITFNSIHCNELLCFLPWSLTICYQPGITSFQSLVPFFCTKKLCLALVCMFTSHKQKACTLRPLVTVCYTKPRTGPCGTWYSQVWFCSSMHNGCWCTFYLSQHPPATNSDFSFFISFAILVNSVGSSASSSSSKPWTELCEPDASNSGNLLMARSHPSIYSEWYTMLVLLISYLTEHSHKCCVDWVQFTSQGSSLAVFHLTLHCVLMQFANRNCWCWTQSDDTTHKMWPKCCITPSPNAW